MHQIVRPQNLIQKIIFHLFQLLCQLMVFYLFYVSFFIMPKKKNLIQTRCKLLETSRNLAPRNFENFCEACTSRSSSNLLETFRSSKKFPETPRDVDLVNNPLIFSDPNNDLQIWGQVLYN